MKYLLIISLLLFVSCKKERTIHITAKNAATGQGYAGLGFILRETKGYVTSSGEVQKKVYEGTLNAQGEAVFNYKLKNNRSYVITTLVPAEELCYINNTSYTLANTDDNFKFDFRFAECAYLKLSIHNVNNQNTNDYFKLFYLGRQVGAQGSNIVGAVIKEGEGNYSYVGSDFSSVPMGERYYKWEVTRNNITTTYYDTLYLNAEEYRTYDINY